MGWDSANHWTKKSIVVAEQLAQYTRTDSTFEVLASKSTKSGLWMVVRNKDTGLKGIFFDLIECHLGRFSVKSMDEGMFPYYFDCPKKFLDMVPPTASEAFTYNLKWRQMVRGETV